MWPSIYGTREAKWQVHANTESRGMASWKWPRKGPNDSLQWLELQWQCLWEKFDSVRKVRASARKAGKLVIKMRISGRMTRMVWKIRRNRQIRSMDIIQEEWHVWYRKYGTVARFVQRIIYKTNAMYDTTSTERSLGSLQWKMIFIAVSVAKKDCCNIKKTETWNDCVKHLLRTWKKLCDGMWRSWATFWQIPKAGLVLQICKSNWI